MSVLLGLLLAVCAFYWAVSTYIDLGVTVIRCRGYSTTSAVPGVAMVTGVVGAVVAREWFGWVDNRAVYLLVCVPDVVLPLGELVFLFRVRVLGWPDRAGRIS